jgi:hypothetical protein
VAAQIIETRWLRLLLASGLLLLVASGLLLLLASGSISGLLLLASGSISGLLLLVASGLLLLVASGRLLLLVASGQLLHVESGQLLLESGLLLLESGLLPLLMASRLLLLHLESGLLLLHLASGLLLGSVLLLAYVAHAMVITQTCTAHVCATIRLERGSANETYAAIRRARSDIAVDLVIEPGEIIPYRLVVRRRLVVEGHCRVSDGVVLWKHA